MLESVYSCHLRIYVHTVRDRRSTASAIILLFAHDYSSFSGFLSVTRVDIAISTQLIPIHTMCTCICLHITQVYAYTVRGSKIKIKRRTKIPI